MVEKKQSITWDIEAGSVFVSVNQRVYPLEVVMGAAFVFIDRAYVLLDRESGQAGRIFVTLRPQTSGAGQADLERLGGLFANELLTQALRYKIAQRTLRMRELIVNRALYATMDTTTSQEVPFEEEDDLEFLDDPLGIAVPWEEKYAADEGKKDAAAQPAQEAEPNDTPAKEVSE